MNDPIKLHRFANDAVRDAITFARQGSPEFARMRRADARGLRRMASEETRKSLPAVVIVVQERQPTILDSIIEHGARCARDGGLAMTHRLHKGQPKVADVTTLAVLQAYRKYRLALKGTLPGLPEPNLIRPLAILTEQFGCHWKVAWRAMEREVSRGNIEYGVSLGIGWLTPEGEAVLHALENPPEPVVE